ncbi:hypothetical protein [Roseospira visakhapatnamensis]|uniref:Uncharacterized protein n=1 Tax=Roseospira visakhapatnamensis TaxID=390880 RepID=A0A7W6RAA4_9PROT|nr:hypothetical protein [Roseospira visakhapatnamensis]MBB4264851.1 hypothetical protein [Roseospira visakhapatnamensis]
MTDATAPSTTPATADAPLPATAFGGAATVTFEHVFFRKVDDIHFQLDQATQQPVAMVSLGDEVVSLPLEGVRKEFAIASDSPDGRMLALLAKGLKFVKGLRLGDPIPREVLTGDASWEPKDKHRQIAYHRLSMQVLGWLSGDEHVITNPDELMQVAGDPTFRRRVNEAFGEAANALMLSSKEQVTDLLRDLSNDLAYIEALRDEFNAIKRAYLKAQDLRTIYANEHSMLATAHSLLRLFNLAVEDFTRAFETVDAQTGEIMAALRNLDMVKTYLHTHRDDLRVRLVVWEDLLTAWLDHPMQPGRSLEDLMAATYRFLGPRYMPVDEWVMMTKLQEPGRKPPETLRVRKEKQIRYQRGRMSWD